MDIIHELKIDEHIYSMLDYLREYHKCSSNDLVLYLIVKETISLMDPKDFLDCFFGLAEDGGRANQDQE